VPRVPGCQSPLGARVPLVPGCLRCQGCLGLARDPKYRRERTGNERIYSPPGFEQAFKDSLRPNRTPAEIEANRKKHGIVYRSDNVSVTGCQAQAGCQDALAGRGERRARPWSSQHDQRNQSRFIVLLMTTAVEGQAERNSTDICTLAGTSCRAIRTNANFGKNSSAVVVSR
jgi:hypothetical protein